MVGVAEPARDSLSPLSTGMLDSRSQASGLCVSSSNGTVSSGDNCGLMLMKPTISIESRRTKYRKQYKEAKRGLLVIYSVVDHLNGSSRPDDTRTNQLIDLIPHNRVLHVVLERRRVGLSLLQNRLHDWIAHNLLYKVLHQSCKESRMRVIRTATSGSRIARCITSSSDSPSR